MKKIIIIISILLLSILSFSSKDDFDFCKGWKDGYKDGYCYQEYSCIPPIPPICPIPRINEDTYKDGYNRGFLKGLEDKK